MSRAAASFTHHLRVRWAEADQQGVVFNGHYLTYFDIGMTEYLRALYDGDAKAMFAIFNDVYVVRSELDYMGSARFDEEIDIVVRPLRLGRSSMTLSFEIRRGDQTLISGQNVYVHAPSGASQPWPDDFRERIGHIGQPADA
ncbi:MAG: thioesterase family protein [Burkholderiaceae bacterium]